MCACSPSKSVWRCEREGEGKCACWCMSESVWRCERGGGEKYACSCMSESVWRCAREGEGKCTCWRMSNLCGGVSLRGRASARVGV